jgi:hypothetical protein
VNAVGREYAPLHDPDNQKCPCQKPHHPPRQRAPKSTLREADNSLDGTELEAAGDPADAADEVCGVGGGGLWVLLAK